MIQFDVANTEHSNRYRQSSIWVEGVEYKIRTPFPYWITFERVISNFQSYDEFDYIYEGGKIGAPKDKEAGLIELIKFYKNEQPLPRDLGNNLDIEVVDWILDSEYIYSAFLSQYKINLITDDIHWHDFIILFRTLRGHMINDIISMRSWTEPKIYKKDSERIKAENTRDYKNKQRWEIRREVFKPFEMR